MEDVKFKDYMKISVKTENRKTKEQSQKEI